MIGAIEFLRKAKAICKGGPLSGKEMDCTNCPLEQFCMSDIDKIENEADLVRKVMAYRLEDGDEK